jgi:hypothetical protein
VADAGDPKVSSGTKALRLLIGAAVLSLGFQSWQWLSRSLPQRDVEVVVDGPITVRRLPLDVAVKYLDSRDWPQDKKFGAAYTHWSFIDRTQFESVLDKQRSKDGLFVFRIAAIKTELTLPITMWLPYGVSAKLHEHEDGHCTICRDLYANASHMAVDCAKKMIGKVYRVRAGSLEDAQVKLNRETTGEFSSCYTKHSDDVAQDISVIYDKITNHGMNNVGTADGIRQATEQYGQKHDSAPKDPARSNQPSLSNDASQTNQSNNAIQSDTPK